MFDISSYLEKFKKFSISRDFLKKSVAEAIKEITNIEVEQQKIEVKNRIVRIKEKPIIKTEIFLKKEEILKKLKKTTENKIEDIL